MGSLLIAQIHRHAWSMIALVLVSLAGCSPSSGRSERVPVEGQVTLDGAPLEIGSILFVPDGSTPGPKAGGPIRGGSFAVPAERGPLPGEMLVEIRAPRFAPGQQLPDDEGKLMRLIVESEELLPGRYNTSTTLHATVTPEGPNRFIFELTTTP